MEESTEPVELGIQLFASGGLMLLMTLVHALGLTIISRILRLEPDRLEEMNFNPTLAQTIDHFPDQWRLIGAVESLTGFLLIGSTTGFIILKTNKPLPD